MKKICFSLFIAGILIQNTDAQLLKEAKKLINSGSKSLTEKDPAARTSELLKKVFGN